MSTGRFVVSLDFELNWGIRDRIPLKEYGKNILGVQKALPKIIEAFEKYGVKATFAIVGLLYAADKQEMLNFCPQKIPEYADKNVSPYNGHFNKVKENEQLDRYHYALSLIRHLQKFPNQEIATHTFSHYYCLKKGQTLEDFRYDILAAIKIAEAKGIETKSIVFPRNQFNNKYVQVLTELGITSYRGNEKNWFFNGKMEEEDKLSKRAFRLLDSYLNISGHNCYDMEEIKKSRPYNIPSSRFLRPFSSKLKIFENLRLKRILKGMTFAAKNRKLYHLWWHPHNFGVYQKENFEILNKILKHYTELNYKYGFESATMFEISNILTVKT